MAKSESPLKWTGGKTRLLPVLRSYLPETCKDFYEPFFGGGALYFNYGFKCRGQAYLNDICRPLMNAYQQLSKNHVQVLDRVSAIRNIVGYDILRAAFNFLKKAEGDLDWTEKEAINYAAHFICLNTMGFNGIYRENKKGEFNVPVGKNSKGERNTCDNLDYEKLKFCGRLLAGVVMESKPFSPWPFGDARPGLGDVLFCDPPYAKEFSNYSKEGFSMDDHKVLNAVGLAAASQGATVIICGSNNSASHEIYGQPTHVVTLQRTIGNFSQSEKKRGKAEEALWVFNGRKP